MQGGLFGLPTSLPTSIPTSFDAAKQQALDAAKAKAQDSATSVMSSDAVKSGLAKAEGVAGSVGLGDQFAKAKDATIGAIEKATGLKLSASTVCPQDRIDVPVLSDVLVATAETPYQTTRLMDSLFSYVVVDSRNPPEAETAQKSKLWYISIANAAFLVVLGMAYGQVSK
jgi:hypothetical protein